MMRSRLKRMILFRGVQQKKLAETVGVSANHLSAIIHGKKNPSLYIAHRLAEELEMPVADVFCTEDIA